MSRARQAQPPVSFRTAGVVLLLFAGLAGSGPASAITWGRMSFDGICRQADVVVQARALDSRVERDEKGHIWTTYRFEVLEQLLPQGPRLEHVEVRQLGGSLDGATLVVPGLPTYPPDQELVLFLQGWGRGWLGVLNGPQGGLPVIDGEVPTAASAFPEVATRDLDTFLDRVREGLTVAQGNQ